MRGYKFMKYDMTCLGFQYEVGKEYSLEGNLKICRNGFHFCKNPFDCLEYYDNIEGDKRLFLVEALGEVITEDNKSVTNKIKIIEEIPNIEKFFDENINNFKINWKCISENQKLSEEFIEKYSNKLNWFCISKYQKLSEEFIDKYKDNVDWEYISEYQTLSEKFIEKYKDKVDWYYISKYQKLSEKFIKKHSDKVEWYWVSKYQTLSKKFIRKYNIIFWLKKIIK